MPTREESAETPESEWNVPPSSELDDVLDDMNEHRSTVLHARCLREPGVTIERSSAADEILSKGIMIKSDVTYDGILPPVYRSREHPTSVHLNFKAIFSRD